MAAGSVKDVDYWLFPEFLEEEKLPMHNQNEPNSESTPILSFPVEFPYEFDSFDSSSSSLGSPVESTQTESSDEDEFLVGLTRRLTQQLAGHPKRKWVTAGSPKSTLSGIGSWSMSSNGSTNGELSPPTTPFAAKNDSWDLISAAAGDVARLKISNEGNKYSNHQRRGLLASANGVKSLNTGFYSSQMRFAHGVSQLHQFHHQHHQIQSRASGIVGYENGRCVRPLGLPLSAWQPLQSRQNKRHSDASTSTVLAVGSAAKTGCTGTGVFLPRRYENASRNKKKSDCSSVLVPAKIAESLNLNLEVVNRQGNTQQILNGVLATNHEALVARRNGIWAQPMGNLQAESVMKYEVCLPQEWIY